MDITQTTTDLYTVELFVHYGDDKATFVGTGATPLEAAEDAANQTSYASGLFDENSSYYEERGVIRTALEAAFLSGRTYAGFGWNTFTLVGSPVDQDKIPDPVEAGVYPKLISDEQVEELVHAHAVAVRRDSIRLFPASYDEATALEPFLIESRRSVTESLEVLEYAHAAFQMQKDRG